jgi:ribosome-binding factor A
MARSPDRAPSQRQRRIAEVMRHGLAEILARGELRHDGLAGVSVTVSEVRVSPDMRNATAFVLPLGGQNADGVIEALTTCAPYIRGVLGRQLQLRHAPQISFTLDTSFDYAERIDSLLRSSPREE